MHVDRWDRLANWHNAWLAADADERAKLRAQLDREQPDLVADADDLAGATEALPGFLDGPAIAAAARDLVTVEPSLETGTTFGPYRIAGLLARGGMSR